MCLNRSDGECCGVEDKDTGLCSPSVRHLLEEASRLHHDRWPEIRDMPKGVERTMKRWAHDALEERIEAALKAVDNFDEEMRRDSGS